MRKFDRQRFQSDYIGDPMQECFDDKNYFLMYFTHWRYGYANSGLAENA